MPVRTMALSRIRNYFNTGYQPGERMLVQKLDFFILTFCCVSYFVNYVRYVQAVCVPFTCPLRLFLLTL